MSCILLGCAGDILHAVGVGVGYVLPGRFIFAVSVFEGCVFNTCGNNIILFEMQIIK